MNDTSINNSTSASQMNATYPETSTLSTQVDPSFVIQIVAKLIYGIVSMLFNIVVANGLQYCELYSITLYLIYAQLLGANLVNLVAESIYPPIVFLCDLTPPPWLDMFVSFVKLVAIHVTIPLEPVMAINRLICVLLPTRAMTILTPRRTIITLIGLRFAQVMAASKQKVPWGHTTDKKRLKFIKTGPIPRLTEREKDFVRPPVIPPDLLNARRCPICEKPVEHVSAHIQRIHSNKRHQCPFCTVQITRKDHLKRHMQTLHPGLFAEMQREQDAEKDAKPRQKCEICFKNVVDLKGHHRKMHGTTDQGFIFECSHCPATFKMTKSLANHTRRAHSHKSLCRSVETSARAGAENQEKEKCVLCGLMIPKSDIRQHKDRHGRKSTVPGVLHKYPCDVCGFRFKTSQHLKRHGIVHLNNGNMIEVDRLPSDQQRSRNWMCAVCAIRFRRKQHLQDHLKTHAKDPQTGLGQTSKGKRQCHICQSWHHHKKISRHIRTHSNTRLFVCGLDFCNKRFSRKADLDNHRLICKEMRAKQRENLIGDRVGDKVQCLRCRKLIRSKDFSRHRRWHFALKLYRCQQCRKCFSRKDHLKKHELTHEKNRKLIPCPLYSCKFECKTKQGLARHLLLNPDCRKGYLGENAKLLKWKSQARGYPEKVVLVDYPVSDDDNEGPGTSFPNVDTLG